MASLAEDPVLKTLDPALHEFAVFLRKQRYDIHDKLKKDMSTLLYPGDQIDRANALLNMLDRVDSAFYKLLHAKHPLFRKPEK